MRVHELIEENERLQLEIARLHGEGVSLRDRIGAQDAATSITVPSSRSLAPRPQTRAWG